MDNINRYVEAKVSLKNIDTYVTVEGRNIVLKSNGKL